MSRARYTLYDDGPVRRRDVSPPRRLLAESDEDAKLEAAILYACADKPSPYRIVRGARRVIYRYPELRG
jgi:hypothetical protein